MSVYDIKSNVIGVVGEPFVKSVAHRGFSSEAPENTLPAFILAKKKGFDFVEADVTFTSDGVAVLLHDTTVDRTSDGTGNIGKLTFNKVRGMDFGSWKSIEYAGTQIPTFEEFISLCKKIALYPYIEIKDGSYYTEAQVQSLVDVVRSYGLIDKAVWLSFDMRYLQYVHAYEPNAKILINTVNITESVIETANNLRGTNEVFIGTASTTDSEIELCKNSGIEVVSGVWDTEEEILNMNPYITGVTSNMLHAGKILYDSIMKEQA